MSLHKTLCIVNPSADKGHAWRTVVALHPLVEEFGGADWVGTVYPMHAVHLAQQAAEAGYKLVIAAGGDGTIHEVINGLMQIPADQRPSLGMIPLGSGNDFAHSMGIRGTPAEALKRVFTGEHKRMDVGRFDIGQGEPQYFNNTFGMGFDATVTIRTQRLTWVRGFLMYFVAVLQTIAVNLDAPRMHIVADGQAWEEKTIMIVACNGPREGGGFAVAPQAVITDGVLNYASVCQVSRLMMLRLIPEVMNGTHGRFKQVRLGQFHQLQLQSEQPLTIHADGEVICGFDSSTRNVKIEVIPQAIDLIS
jgi:YegS/Rv2252/BmrU family lipid kinase